MRGGGRRKEERREGDKDKGTKTAEDGCDGKYSFEKKTHSTKKPKFQFNVRA